MSSYREVVELEAGDLSDADVASLRKVSGATYFRKVLKKYLEEIEGVENQVLSGDFTTDQGIKEAILQQGKLRGMVRFLDFLEELIQDEAEPLDFGDFE